jgi:hypothetical protein
MAAATLTAATLAVANCGSLGPSETGEPAAAHVARWL